MTRTIRLALLLLAAGCNVDKWDPPNVAPPGQACANGQHSCGPSLGCCIDDTEMCCGLPESVGCNVPNMCMEIGSLPEMAARRDGGPAVVPQRAKGDRWVCRSNGTDHPPPCTRAP